MIKTVELAAYLNDYLNLSEFPGDISNNGLQVEASESVRRVVLGVDASLELFNRAAAIQADLIIVHHGISWGSEPRRFAGWVGRRLAVLFQHHISLYAVHLPLDGHPVSGHNALLAGMIQLENREMFAWYDGAQIGVKGTLPQPATPAELAAVYQSTLNCRPWLFGCADRPVRRIGCISGGAGHDGLDAAIADGLDALVTGEMEHELYHQAKECGIAVIALGHYCSEKPGILALGELIHDQFGLATEFIDIPTGL